MLNATIRTRAKEHGVLLWQIAEAVGVTDGTFSRKLRHELPADERERILTIIDQIAAKRKEVI